MIAKPKKITAIIKKYFASISKIKGANIKEIKKIKYELKNRLIYGALK